MRLKWFLPILMACATAVGQVEPTLPGESFADRLKPKNGTPQALLEAAEWRLLANKRDGIADLLALALTTSPDNAAFHVRAARVYSFIGDDGAAIARYLRAIALEPTSADHHLDLALLLATQKKPDRKTATLHYDKARALGAPRDKDLEKRLR